MGANGDVDAGGEGGVEAQRGAGFDLGVKAFGSEEFAQAGEGAVTGRDVGWPSSDIELFGEVLGCGEESGGLVESMAVPQGASDALEGEGHKQSVAALAGQGEDLSERAEGSVVIAKCPADLAGGDERPAALIRPAGADADAALEALVRSGERLAWDRCCSRSSSPRRYWRLAFPSCDRISHREPGVDLGE